MQETHAPRKRRGERVAHVFAVSHPTGPQELSLAATPMRNCLNTGKLFWRRERDSNPTEAPVRSVSYCNFRRSGPRMSPLFPVFATRFATRGRVVAAGDAHPKTRLSGL